MESNSWNAAVRQNTNCPIFKSAVKDVQVLELRRNIWQIQKNLELTVYTYDMKKIL